MEMRLLRDLLVFRFFASLAVHLGTARSVKKVSRLRISSQQTHPKFDQATYLRKLIKLYNEKGYSVFC